jgi:tetratricopeptide (TPR) repeat protein
MMLNLGDTYRKAKDFSKAEENLNEGLKRILKVGDKYWEACAYKYFGWFYRDIGNVKLARDYLTKAYELFSSIGAKADAADVSQSLLLLEKQKK